MSNWIKIEDQLPPDSTEVFMYSAAGEKIIGTKYGNLYAIYGRVTSFKKFNFIINYFYKIIYGKNYLQYEHLPSKITHWQPLPEAPNE